MSTGAPIDQNSRQGLFALASDASGVLVPLVADKTTGRLLTDSAGGGTVSSVSVVTANGFAGTVATATTTPAITLSTTITGTLQGNGTAITASKLILTQPATGSTLTVADGKTLTANVSMTLQGGDTSVLSIAASKTLTASNTLTFTGTDGSSVAFGTGGTVLYGNQTVTLTGDITGSGATSIATTLATVNSNVGTFGSATQASVVTVNGKGLVTAASSTTVTPAVGSITGLGTGVSTFLATPSSANLAAALTDETGTGAAVFASKPTFIGTVQTVTAMGAQAINGSLGNVFTRTLAASETFTQSNFTTGQFFIVEVTNAAGGGDTVTWFSGVTWVTSGGTAPVQAAGASGITTYGFRCTGTNTFLGYLVGTN